MKIYKLTISILMVFIILMSFCACGGVPYSYYASQTETSDNKSKEASNTSDNIAIEDTVIYDANNIKVVLEDFTSDSFKYEVINTSDEQVTFLFNYVVLNNCLVYDYNQYSKSIIPGKKLIDIFDFSAFEYYGMKKIYSMDVNATIWVGDDYTSHELEVSVLTSQHNPVPNINGNLCYEDDNIEIYTIPNNNNLNNIEYYIHNKTNTKIEVDCGNCAVNGVMADNYYGWGYTILYPKGYYYSGASNSSAITVWSALDDEIKEKGFDNVNEIVASVRVFLDVDGDSTSYNLDSVCLLGIK